MRGKFFTRSITPPSLAKNFLGDTNADSQCWHVAANILRYFLNNCEESNDLNPVT